MSPVATNGPPHARGASVNGGVPVNAINGAKAGGMDGMKGTNRVFSHLDDLLAARPDVDMNSPIRRLLQEGEALAKQADTFLDFKRPDVALQEYMKASIVAVELVPHHKDYPSLLADRGDLHRLYNGLNKRINAQHEKFAAVKQVIKENNARNGVKSTLQAGAGGRQVNGAQNGHTRSQSTQSSALNGSATNGTPPRQKPPVQPKPDALHGNAIRPQSGGNTPSTDLATRFANLRTPEPKQDPRIRTQPILVPSLAASTTSPVPAGSYTTMNKSSGPRDFPSVPRTIPRSTQLPLGINIPAMPKPPAAVYDSPIRGPEAASANLLSSRSSSYKTNGNKASAPPISTVGPTPTQVDNRTDYFDIAQPAHTSGDDGYARKQSKRAPVLSDSPVVSAEELVDLLAQSSHFFRVLLVDLRSREEFDTGHIMSQFIICVEPITLRRGISGEELAESMVIAPDLEQNLYDQRDEFDLIVFYDQSSDSLNSSKSGASEAQSTLKDFVSAVSEYGYDKKTKRHPKLLSGGIDAWVDLLGPNSLKTSLNGASFDAGRSGLKSGRPLSRTSVARANNLPMKRRRTYTSRPLTKEEESHWDSTLKEESVARSPVAPDDSQAQDLVYARTTEDFFRRYPELPVIQESMMKPQSISSGPQSHEAEFVSMVPPPPARPAPALPRQRSSGISERGPIAQYAHTAGDSITHSRVAPGLTGLQNPNNLCYMNATLQVLSATPFLREMLLGHRYPPQVPIPRKSGETGDPPQLMVRSLSNLLSHLWAGQYDFVTPNTVRKYINSLHVGTNITDYRIRERAFGGSARQHDSLEFFLWLANIIADETNPRRNLPEWNLDNELEIQQLNADPSTRRATNLFRRQKLFHLASDLQSRTDIMEMNVTICAKCGAMRRNWQNNILKAIIVTKEPPVQRLVDAIALDTGPGSEEGLKDYGCESCGTLAKDGSAKVVFGKEGEVLARSWRYQVWLPDYLWISLNRYNNALQKIETTFTFPEKGLDLSSTFAPPDPPTPDYPIPRQQQGPFLYDVYAVIQHGGRTIAGGHYWTIMKSPDKPGKSDGAGTWHKFNDSAVTPASFKDTQTSNTSGIFLVRQGAPLL